MPAGGWTEPTEVLHGFKLYENGWNGELERGAERMVSPHGDERNPSEYV